MAEKKILIVDDDEVLLKILDKKLSSAGCSVAKATNGKDAISIARRRRPDLIILDIMMPAMNGIEVAKELEKDYATKDIPIIFLTALLTKEEEKERKVIRGRSCLAKPLNMKDLLKEIKKHL